jgi:hypothetical protein
MGTPPTTPRPQADWRDVLSIQNMLAVAAILVGVGGYVRQMSYLEMRITALETRVERQAMSFDSIYMRQDVAAQMLLSMEKRLVRIEQAVVRDSPRGTD